MTSLQAGQLVLIPCMGGERVFFILPVGSYHL